MAPPGNPGKDPEPNRDSSSAFWLTRFLRGSTVTSACVRSGGEILSASRTARLFRTGEAVEILGLSRRQLRYWAQTDFVCPSARTRGGHHRYTFRDLVALKAAKRLIDAGISLQRIRASIAVLKQRLPDVDEPLRHLVLVATGDVALVFDGDTAFEALTGQEWILDVARFQQEVAGWASSRRAPSPHSGSRPNAFNHSMVRPG